MEKNTLQRWKWQALPDLFQGSAHASYQLADRVLDWGLNLAASQVCKICGKLVLSRHDGVTCQACWTDYGYTGAAYQVSCLRCGRWRARPTERNVAEIQSNCDHCQEMAFSQARSCGPYLGALRENLLLSKRHPYLPNRLRSYISTAWAQYPELHQASRILPVPLARGRLRERGHNQAELIAGLLAAQSGIELDSFTLARIAETERHRVGMDAHRRAKSVQRAFQVVCPQLIENKTVLLVDDVFTTGATIEACTRALLVAGAKEVLVFTVARTMRYCDLIDTSQ